MESINGLVPVRAAAEQLGVTAEQVRDLVAAGHLIAVKAGRELFIRTSSIHHRLHVVHPTAGRPLSPRMAWAVLFLASGMKPEWVSAAELVRVRRYRSRPLPDWPRLLARRTARHTVQMLPALAKRLRSWPEVVVGGLEAANAHGAGLVAASDSTTALYVSATVAQRLRKTRGVRWEAGEPDFVLHEVPEDLPDTARLRLFGSETTPIAVAALDLLDMGDERATRAAADLLRDSGPVR